MLYPFFMGNLAPPLIYLSEHPTKFLGHLRYLKTPKEQLNLVNLNPFHPKYNLLELETWKFWTYTSAWSGIWKSIKLLLPDTAITLIYRTPVPWHLHYTSNGTRKHWLETSLLVSRAQDVWPIVACIWRAGFYPSCTVSPFFVIWYYPYQRTMKSGVPRGCICHLVQWQQARLEQRERLPSNER